MQPGSPDALFAAIAQSGNEVTQGWMRVMAGAPAAASALPWGDATLQRSYFDKQARLWTALASGKRETLATPAAGDRRFAAREWRDNPYYDYLKQSYLLAAEYLKLIPSAVRYVVYRLARPMVGSSQPEPAPATTPDSGHVVGRAG